MAVRPTRDLIPGDPDYQAWLDRRELLRQAGWSTLGLLAGCRSGERRPALAPARPEAFATPAVAAERGLTPADLASRHVNFYELLPWQAGDVSRLTPALSISPWTLEVDGLCRRPGSFAPPTLLDFPLEERTYHFRCVERWAMTIPWIGFPLARLLEQVEPGPEVSWVVFESACTPEAMPGVRATPELPWPYREALRIDEARHPLTLLALGVFGRALPKAHGAPVRLVVPWKYGYKSAKSLRRISLVSETPTTFWSRVAPHEYGLLSNVNPHIPHPRWRQNRSFWLTDESVWPTQAHVFPTPLFNAMSRTWRRSIWTSPAPNRSRSSRARSRGDRQGGLARPGPDFLSRSYSGKIETPDPATGQRSPGRRARSPCHHSRPIPPRPKRPRTPRSPSSSRPGKAATRTPGSG